MNRYIGSRIEAGDPETMRFKIVFYYWILMSQAIEFAYKRNKGMEINENRFHEVVSLLEHIKGSVEQGVWPDFTINDMEVALGVA